MATQLVDLTRHERRMQRRKRPFFGESVYRLCLVVLLIIIVLQLSDVIGLLTAIREDLWP